jgi:2-hydroxymuconate-semialdehyde hydrolase
MEEQQFEFEGIPVTYYQGGRGKPLLLLHGSGPGASSVGNWRTVLGPLAQRFEVFAMDLIGFGKSGRKPAGPYFDYLLWVRQAEAMLERIVNVSADKSIGLVGHSLSGSLALTLASRNPDIGAVLTTGTMGSVFTAADALRRAWTCPANREQLTMALQGLIFDHSVITESYLAAREPVIFAAGYADYFNQMFNGDPAQYVSATTLSAATLAAITCPVTMLHGRDDTAVPPSNSVEIARQLPRADLVLLRECSHSVAFERPDVVLAMAGALFDDRTGTSLA